MTQPVDTKVNENEDLSDIPKLSLRELVAQKLQDAENYPDLDIGFTPEEMEEAGAFEETALTFEDVIASRHDTVG